MNDLPLKNRSPQALNEASNIPVPDPRAMEEWKQLQTIIGRLQGLEYLIRGWMLLLMGGLVTALFGRGSRMSYFRFARDTPGTSSVACRVTRRFIVIIS